MSIAFPNIDPVIIQLGPLAVRWYALAYVAGILLGWWYLIRLNKKDEVLNKKALDDIIVWATLGIILGGRLGYVLFYNAEYYFTYPLEILKVWSGGMSFHGGLVGLLAAIYLLCCKEKLSFLRVMDLVACVAPIGLFFGRVANFINGELYGRVTDVAWGVVFPGGGELPRHPSQLYEALLEGLALFIIMVLLIAFTKIRKRPGALGGVFLMGYALSRSVVEFFREPDEQIGFLFHDFTMGQLLSAPMFLIGLVMIIWSIRAKKHHVS